MSITPARENGVDARVADVCHSDEDLERALLVRLPDTALDITLDFGFPLFTVSADRINMACEAIWGMCAHVVNPRSFL